MHNHICYWILFSLPYHALLNPWKTSALVLKWSSQWFARIFRTISALLTPERTLWLVNHYWIWSNWNILGRISDNCIHSTFIQSHLLGERLNFHLTNIKSQYKMCVVQKYMAGKINLLHFVRIVQYNNYYSSLAVITVSTRLIYYYVTAN